MAREAYGVFEGGGVKGIALVGHVAQNLIQHLGGVFGAVQQVVDVGAQQQIHAVKDAHAGTSWGDAWSVNYAGSCSALSWHKGMQGRPTHLASRLCDLCVGPQQGYARR